MRLGSWPWALTRPSCPETLLHLSELLTQDKGSFDWVFISCPRAPDVPSSSLLIPQVSAQMSPPQRPLFGLLKVGDTVLGALDHHPGSHSIVDKPRGQCPFPTALPTPSTWQGSGGPS